MIQTPQFIQPLAVLTASLALTILVPSSSAVEVTVQNDSVTDGSSVVIQAGFVAGESAAAWLTAPCTGDIVAVQVFWRSLIGGSPQSLEDSITIFDAGTFPIPGPQLALLEGPVMTDGVINEFRFLDQNQTIPLIVPVVAGQTFVVSFKFFNTPPPTGPSVVNDLDGCQPGKNGLFAIPGGWLSSCLIGVGGDWFIRAVIDCGALTGGCCLDENTCLNAVTQTDCAAQGGVYLGDSTDCVGNPCASLTGGCCFDDGAGGEVCIDGFPASDCAPAGGTFIGIGQICPSVTQCFITGACCLPDGTCQEVTSTVCNAQNGLYLGDGTLCAAVTCPDPLGACCFTGGVCQNIIQVNCNLIPDTTWLGPGTDCATPNICTPPCPGDITPPGGNGTVNIDDLVALLSAFGPCPVPPASCPPDITPLGGNGVVNIDDLVALLSAFGPCP